MGDSRPKDTREATQADDIALLLAEIEKERVPERLLDLATRLQNALNAHRAARDTTDRS